MVKIVVCLLALTLMISLADAQTRYSNDPTLYFTGGNLSYNDTTIQNLLQNEYLTDTNLILNFNVSASYYFGDGSQLTGILYNYNHTLDTYNLYNDNWLNYCYNSTYDSAIQQINSTFNQTFSDSLYTYYSDDDYIIKNNTNGFNFNGTKLQTQFFNLSSIDLISGTAVGDISYVQLYDDNSYNITESSGVNGLDIRVNFTGINNFNQIIIRYSTALLESHNQVIQLWDYNSGSWEGYANIGLSSGYTVLAIPVFDNSNHISNGLVQLRIYQSSNGNTGHIHYYDWISISDGLTTGGGSEVDPLSIHLDEINTTQLFYDSELDINQSWLDELYAGVIWGYNMTMMDYSNVVLSNQSNLFTENQNMTGYNLTVDCIIFSSGGEICSYP